MNVDWREAGRADRLTVPVQTRLSDAEAEELGRFVEWCQAQGIDASRSSAVRAFVRAGLRAHQVNVSADFGVASDARPKS